MEKLFTHYDTSSVGCEVTRLVWICIITECILGDNSVVYDSYLCTLRRQEAERWGWSTQTCVFKRERERVNQIFVNEWGITPSSLFPALSPFPPLILLCQLLLVRGVIKMIGSCGSDGVFMLHAHACVCAICLQVKFNPPGLSGWVWVNGEDRKCQRSLTSSLSHLSHSVNPFRSLAHFTSYSVTAYRWIVGVEGMKVWSQIGFYRTTCDWITRWT